MTRIIASLAEISAGYDALFCDLWGCLHNGQQPYEAAVAALREYRQAGGKVCLMTNAPRPNQYVIAQLDRMGVPRDAWDIVVSSGDAAQEAMFRGEVGRKLWHIGLPKDDGFFTDIPAGFEDAPAVTRVDLADAEGIVASGPFDEENETPEHYADRFRDALERGLPMLCANPDIIVDMGDKRIYCAGALAQYYEELGGKVLYFGKPHAPIYDRARRLLALGDQARFLAVGDGINTDVEGAEDQGIDSIFVTGGLAAEEFGDDVENPRGDMLEDWLKRKGRAPSFAIGRLR
ncbi:TIGR01459 family HAD-type hydrolase [Paracoccus sp. 1_MG-2023]|uniref:TIGR01459 family HAD-type hydrolase n=1 Tax=unclassified Paracoccus (in: a-proteobacteria) TaxID=2688777 RepID=UPI001C0A4A00|nr:MULTISPECIES: TIGR01459 family HAD-type hydrolase [unclassified Paracoccus (in: a-proteobacteria)]MBU2956742.1 TIGR01459 family HAD-type hydrolase [Paracoccus sp. C2R09]MDO6669219.1 TIGR01459 family HAD-type hydrolase [Paracoccus sp. 1_MG-2023]